MSRIIGAENGPFFHPPQRGAEMEEEDATFSLVAPRARITFVGLVVDS